MENPAPNCILVRREIMPRGPASAVLLALHGDGGGVDQLAPLCTDLRKDLCVVLPQSWRTLHIHGMAEAEDPGHSWYFAFEDGRPEPATFGDCLIELEGLVYDLHEKYPDMPLFIMGIGQGAVLALGLGSVVPDYVAGIVAIGGHIPKIRGWRPPFEDYCGLPVLLVQDLRAPRELYPAGATQRELVARNADVSLSRAARVMQSPLAAAAPIRDWLTARLRALAALRSVESACLAAEE